MQNHNISLVESSAGSYQASLVVGALTSRGLSSQKRVCDTCHCILHKYKILRLWTPNNMRYIGEQEISRLDFLFKSKMFLCMPKEMLILRTRAFACEYKKALFCVI